MSTETKALITKLTTLRDLLRKNCGVGPGGFLPGNTCGRTAGGNSTEGSQRRRKRGKKRKRRGPDRGIGARTRAAQRKRAGRHNDSRRKWREDLTKPTGSPAGRALYRSHAEERKDLADAFKAERKAQAKEKQNDFKATAKEIKGERKELARDQHKERVSLKKEQAREIAKVDKEAARDHARLDAKYEAAKVAGKNPEKLEQAYQERKREIDATHAEAKGDMEAEHRQARADMKLSQREDRSQAREEHRDSIESIRDDHRAVTNDQHTDQREQIYDLKTSHRAERAELAREIRDEGWKAFEFVDVKATPDLDGVPTAQAILDGVLAEMGHAEVWADGSLDGESRLKVLHEVRLAGRRWFRSEAQSVLDSLGEKALFGAAKAKLGAFFDRAAKYVREIAAAGLLAVAGPGPVNQQEAIVTAYEQQVKIQAEYLADFRKQIVAGDRPLDGTFVSRAEQYGNAVWGTTQSILREGTLGSPKIKFERRIHAGPRTPTDPCPQCVKLERKGWQPLGTLPPIGFGTECGGNCHCHFKYCEYVGGPRYIFDLGKYFLLPGGPVSEEEGGYIPPEA